MTEPVQIECNTEVVILDGPILRIQRRGGAARLLSKVKQPIELPASATSMEWVKGGVGVWNVKFSAGGQAVLVACAGRHFDMLDKLGEQLGSVLNGRDEAKETRKEVKAEARAERAQHPWLYANESEFGIRLANGEIHCGGEGGPIAGCHATVETAGDIDRRITATRLILTGPFAFGLRKKKDKRELYITVEGDGFAFVAPVDPKKGAEARRFAARLTSFGSQAAKDGATSPAPSQTPGSASSSSVADELAKLAALRDQGILTDDEFTAQKSKLLGG